MKNTFGQSVAITVFGESHGEAIGAVIDGLAPGIDVDMDYIKLCLNRRRPALLTDTARKEKDEFKILSGVFNGKTTGTPICIVIPNEDKKSGDYEKVRGLARPSHADFAASCKYHGYEDYRGGGHFSGRITASIVAAGAILTCALKKVGINFATHINYCGGVFDREFNKLNDDIEFLRKSDFPMLDKQAEENVKQVIIEAKNNLDSIGGITQTVITGMPEGVGEPWFDSVESIISHAMFSIGGIKGIEFGAGFKFADKKGSECNDAFVIDNGKIGTETNNNGGINGGITNGMPIVFNCAIKPTPSIGRMQKTVDFINGRNTELKIQGRHDPAILRRICPVIDSVTALVLCDLLAQRYGTDVFVKGI